MRQVKMVGSQWYSTVQGISSPVAGGTTTDKLGSILGRLTVTGTGQCTNALKFDGNCGTNQFFSPRADHISEILIDANGKYVGGGSAGTPQAVEVTISARSPGFAANKNFQNKDTSFSGDGVVRPNFENSKHDWCKGGAIDANGKIVIVGYVNVTWLRRNHRTTQR